MKVSDVHYLYNCKTCLKNDETELLLYLSLQFCAKLKQVLRFCFYLDIYSVLDKAFTSYELGSFH